MSIKSLVLDIETRPLLSYTWGLWDQNISLGQIKEDDAILCWSAKWLGDEDVWFSSVNMTTERKMLRELYDMINEADELIGWNSNKFDIRWLNGQFALQGWGPPAPAKKVDLMLAMRRSFKLASNKLDYFLTRFGIPNKVEHDGFSLWVGCMNGEKEAWDKMEEYNVGDVLRTEAAYLKLLPWINTGINRSAAYGDVCCPNCGGTKFQSRGLTYTTGNAYRRFQCTAANCGKWFRGNKTGDKQPTLMAQIP
jgi:hypothetical protein